ncbi:MAG: baseplate J/gp47 family protein [Gammaproteobacteria bacterium]
MPLPLPKLDDRRWNDLVEEGRALVPRYAPTWTDHNVHDPGITLMELFAWLTEMTIYRLDRVPETHRRKFLALIGYDPLPPRVAQTTLTFKPEPGTAPFLLPEGAEFKATDVDGQPVRFRTLRDLSMIAVALKAIQVEGVDASGVRGIHDRTQDWRDQLPIRALGLDAQPGDALYLGFTILPTEVPITLAFRFQGPGSDREERTRILREAKAQRAVCRPALPEIPCNEDIGEVEHPIEALPPHHSARLVWETYTGAAPEPWVMLQPAAEPQRPDVGEVRDDTRALTLDGIVEINLPSTVVETALGGVAEPLFYLRCRLTAGGHDAPPIVIDIAPTSVIAEQALPFAESLTIAAGVTPIGPAPVPGTTRRFNVQLDDSSVIRVLEFDPPGALGPAVVVLQYEAPSATVTGRITWELVRVGRGNGAPNQRMLLPRAPVQVESLAFYIHQDQNWETWIRRDSLDASARTDLHFVLDPMSGEIGFGDGERGRAPSPGTLIFAAYRATRAAQGNVRAESVTRLADSPRNTFWLGAFPADVREPLREQLSRITTNRVPAMGGADLETLVAATGRAVEVVHAHERLLEVCAEAECQTLDQLDSQRARVLRAPTRAVNLLDIERLVLEVPGTRIARARAWASIHPAYPCLTAPGVITVVIVPDQPVAKPVPTAGLLGAVLRYLDQRRMVTMWFEVVGPEYLEVRVHARVRTKAYIDPIRVRDRIQTALDTFLDPRRGGPEGMGWPFGRDVYRSEILQLIDGVPGVDHVLALSLSAGSGEARCGNLPLCPTWLVTPGPHQIEMA